VSPDLLHGDETCVWGDHAYRGRRADIRPGQIYRWRREIRVGSGFAPV
jgi:hypothetical protein